MDIYPRVELLDHIVTLENPAMATGLEKFNLHPNFQEGQYKRMFKPLDSCTYPPC